MSSNPKQTPTWRRWQRFKANRRGYVSLILFTLLFVASLFAEVISNDKPFVVHYNGQFYFPLLTVYPETTFGGEFDTEADYQAPAVRQRLAGNGNWALMPPNPHSYASINLNINGPVPSPPSAV
ncbi:MAG: ABC transporter permease, partial [Thermodesulfobacteriota bacterium]